VNVSFSSSSEISNDPGLGPTPLVECARHVAASARAISRRSAAAIVSTGRRQLRSRL
jgi:hypothetical protein